MSQQMALSAPEERFRFGANWRRFLSTLTEERVRDAEVSLRRMLDLERLDGKTFLDIGSGSGLFSLAARRLGAQVHSFDYDPLSVACTRELKRRHFNDDSDWTVGEGSVLDERYVASLGKFDIVYSWGVLHHTGDMRRAIDNATLPVKPGGRLFIAIYNDQGIVSIYWSLVKRIYNAAALGRATMIILHAPYLIGTRVLLRLATGRRHLDRGMAYWYDMLDWLGGWPFEVATPDTVIGLLGQKGFTLDRMTTVGRRHGCNEFVFTRREPGLVR